MISVTFLLIPLILGTLLGFVTGIVMILGGLGMLKLKSHGVAVFASFLALLPIGPVWLISLPIGIWSLVVLHRRNVKTAFNNRARRGLATTSDGLTVPEKPTQPGGTGRHSAVHPMFKTIFWTGWVTLAILMVLVALNLPSSQRVPLSRPFLLLMTIGVVSLLLMVVVQGIANRDWHATVLGAKPIRAAAIVVLLLCGAVALWFVDNAKVSRDPPSTPSDPTVQLTYRNSNQTDFSLIQGRWEIVSQVKNGETVTPAQRGMWIEFSGEMMRSDTPKTPRAEVFFAESRFTLNPASVPPEIDVLVIGARGIYQLDRDTLTMAVADAGIPRPSTYASGIGSRVTLTVCRRLAEGPEEHGAAESVGPQSPEDQLLDAADKGQLAVVKKLLDAGASVNAKNAEGQTPLMKAVSNGHRSLALSLVLLGADLSEQDKRGQTVLMIAAENRDSIFFNRLFDLQMISCETDPEKRQTKLRAFPGIDRMLLTDRNIDLQNLDIYEIEVLADVNGETAPMKAARTGDTECFQLLTQHMSTYLARDKLGRTVLMHVVLGDQVEQSSWLESFQSLMKPPYYGVAGVDNIYIGGMLIFELERSLSVLDNDGKSALHIANEHGKKQIAEVLRRHLEAIVANQTATIEKGGDNLTKHYQVRGLAWRALGEKEKSESDLAKAAPK